MKNNVFTVRVDEDELKVIHDELERRVYDNQQQLFNAIYDRVIKPHIEKSKDFEKELRKEKLRLEKLMDASDSEDYFLIQWRVISKVLGES